MWLIILILVLIASVHMVLGVALYDTCVYLDKQEDLLFQKDGNVELAAQSCLTNRTLASTFGFEDELEFANIDIDSSIVPTERDLEVDRLRSLDALVGSMTVESAFGLDPTIIDNDLVSFNTDPFYTSIVGSTYNRSTIESSSTLDFGTGGEAVRTALRTKILQAVALETELQQKIDAMNADVDAMVAKMDESMDDLTAAKAEVDRMDEIVEPAQIASNNLIEGTRCGFLGQTAVNVRARLCNGVQASSILLALCLVLFAALIVTEMQINAAVGSANDYKEYRNRLRRLMSNIVPAYANGDRLDSQQDSIVVSPYPENVVVVNEDIESKHHSSAVPPQYETPHASHIEAQPPSYSSFNVAANVNAEPAIAEGSDECSSLPSGGAAKSI